MRHRGPVYNPLTTAPHPASPTPQFSHPSSTRRTTVRAHRRLLAITAALASLAGSGVAVAIGTSMAASTPPRATNLLANPGFEDGLTSWTRSTSGVATSGVHHSGTHAADLRAAPVSAADRTRLRRTTTLSLTTDATTTSVAGGVYHASVWAAAPTGPAEAEIRLSELRGGRVVGQRVVWSYQRNASWHMLSLSYTAESAGDTLRFSVVASELQAGHTLLADDASLTLASDPTPTVTDTSTPTSSPTPTTTPTPSVTPSSPPPTSGTLIGATFGTSQSGTEAQFPNMAVAHFYYGGAPSTWGGAMAAIPAGQTIIVSFNYDVASTAAGGSDAAFTQVLRSWASSGRTIYWNWQHEADDPAKAISPTAYRAGWDHLLADAAAVNAPNLHSMSIIMAIALTGVHGPVDSWYIPGVDVVGFDSYYLSTELLAEQYAAAKSKPLAFPEFGAAIGGSPDAISAAFATSFLAALDSNTIAAVWFNNNGNDLASHPATLAVLKAAAG